MRKGSANFTEPAFYYHPRPPVVRPRAALRCADPVPSALLQGSHEKP
jgi:hypothetical protein